MTSPPDPPSRHTTERPPLRDAFDTAAQKQRYVRGLFATIADRYDLITVFFSYGQDRRWKERLVTLAGLKPGARVLDLATGTGDIAFLAAAQGADVVGLDVTLRMIQLANAKRDTTRAGARFLVGDMTALPFADARFDVITTGYGLRNVPDLPLALREAARVLAPGGRLLSLDFNRPANPLIRSLYLFYLSVVGGVVGWILHRDPDTYRYIPASIRNYPGAAGVTQLLRDSSFKSARHLRVLGGLMAIHEAEK